MAKGAQSPKTPPMAYTTEEFYKMRLLIKKLKENAVIPARQTEFSAGYDLCACTDAPITIKVGQTEKIHRHISRGSG